MPIVPLFSDHCSQTVFDPMQNSLKTSNKHVLDVSNIV